MLPLVDVAFESRLTPRSPQIDLSVRLTHEDVPNLLTFCERDAVESESVRWSAAGWARVFRLSEAWIANDASWSTVLDSLWIEFDIVSGEAVPAPMPFLLLRSGVGLGDLVALDPIVRCFSGDEQTGVLAALSPLDALLPSHVTVRAIGLLEGRAGSPVRVALSAQSAGEAAALLERVGLAARASRARTRLEETFDACALFLDVYEGRVTRAGLAYQKPALFARFDWRPVFDAFVSEGLCERPVADALLAWTGTQACETASPSWPREMRDAREFLGARVQLGLLRDVFRIKLVEDDGVSTLKVYFGALRTLLRRRAS